MSWLKIGVQAKRIAERRLSLRGLIALGEERSNSSFKSARCGARSVARFISAKASSGADWLMIFASVRCVSASCGAMFTAARASCSPSEVFPYSRQNSCERKPWLNEVRLQANRSPKMRHRTLSISLLRQDPSQGGLRCRTLRSHADCLLKFRPRRCNVAFRERRPATLPRHSDRQGLQTGSSANSADVPQRRWQSAKWLSVVWLWRRLEAR